MVGINRSKVILHVVFWLSPLVFFRYCCGKTFLSVLESRGGFFWKIVSPNLRSPRSPVYVAQPNLRSPRSPVYVAQPNLRSPWWPIYLSQPSSCSPRSPVYVAQPNLYNPWSRLDFAQPNLHSSICAARVAQLLLWFFCFATKAFSK